MSKAYIIGVGGFAKEVYFLLLSDTSSNQEFVGFIDKDDSINKIKIGDEEFPVFNEDEFLSNSDYSEANVYLGIGDPKIIEKVSKKFENFNFPNLIHPSVKYHKDSVSFGRGNIITAGCIFTVDIRIGSFNIFNLNTTLGHDAIIGDSNVINPGVNISGSVVVKSNNLVGTNATILQEIEIGSNNTIGASTLVNKNVDDNNIIVGVPGKPLNRK